MYDYAVVIGRFQPLHREHEKLIARAVMLAKKTIVVFGSCGQARDLKNPWTLVERAGMLKAAFPGEWETGELTAVGAKDIPESDVAWAAQIVSLVHGIVRKRGNGSGTVCLVGNRKPDCGYLDLFPVWNKNITKKNNMSATEVRALYFADEDGYMDAALDKLLTPQVRAWLKGWAKTNHYHYEKLVAQFMEEANAKRAV